MKENIVESTNMTRLTKGLGEMIPKKRTLEDSIVHGTENLEKDILKLICSCLPKDVEEIGIVVVHNHMILDILQFVREGDGWENSVEFFNGELDTRNAIVINI